MSTSPLRIIIHAIGSAGDVHPFIGIGIALQKRGHEVFIITNPVFQDRIIGNGLGFRPLGTEEAFNLIKKDPDLWHPHRAFAAVVRHAVDPSYEPILETTRELHVPGRTVLVASSLAFAARNARNLLDIPMVTVHLAPSLFPSVYRQPEIHGMVFGSGAPKFLKRLQWAVGGRIVDHHALPALNRFRREHGLAPAKHLLREWWHSPDRVIALFPDWFAAPQPDWPVQVRQTGFSMFDGNEPEARSPDLEKFLSEGPAPVIFTPGSAMIHGHAFFEEAVGAIRQLGCRAIFLTGSKDHLPHSLPAGTAHFSYVPFSKILPRAAVLVHHGGIGTCAQALQAGIPQLIQPMAHDQLDTLSRVRDLGVGLGIAPAKFKAKNIVAALEKLLGDSGFKNRAVETAKQFDVAGWMDGTCEWIEKLANHGDDT